jgi:hypothetical protein
VSVDDFTRLFPEVPRAGINQLVIRTKKVGIVKGVLDANASIQI